MSHSSFLVALASYQSFTCELEANLFDPMGLSQFSLDKLVASISPCGLTGKEMLVKGFDWGKEAVRFPHGDALTSPLFPVTMAL